MEVHHENGDSIPGSTGTGTSRLRSACRRPKEHLFRQVLATDEAKTPFKLDELACRLAADLQSRGRRNNLGIVRRLKCDVKRPFGPSCSARGLSC